MEDELLAETTHYRTDGYLGKVYTGNLLCPSKKRARDIMLSNYENLFKEFSQQGLNLEVVSALTYDNGGCACEKCQPWIVTWGKLFLEIAGVAKRYYPDIKLRLIGWWWTKEDHRIFKEWADKEAVGKFDEFSLMIPEGDDATDPLKGVDIPERCSKQTFIHINFGDKIVDDYSHWGAVIATHRIPGIISYLQKNNFTGFMAYSEGYFEDLNKAILGGLASGKFNSLDEVLQAYAERYFGISAQKAKDWANWFSQFGDPQKVDLAKAREELERLKKNVKEKEGWRFKQWESKLRLLELNHQVLNKELSVKERQKAAEDFWTEKENLYRGIWKLGLPRWVFSPLYSQPDWCQEFPDPYLPKGLRISSTWPL